MVVTTPTDFNLQTLRGRAFEGFVQFQIPTTTIPPSGVGAWYRMKERQNMTFAMNFDRARHYSDDGLLAVDPAGISHNFNMSIKVTSDLFDNVFSESSDKQTLSYWIYRNTVNQPIQVIFVTSFTTLLGPDLDTNEKDVNLKFVLDPSTFSPTLGASGGSPEISISGTVVSITSAIRSTTTEQDNGVP